MLHYVLRNRRIEAVLVGMILFLVTVLEAVTFGYALEGAVEDGGEGKETVNVYTKRERDGEWSVSLSRSLVALSRGRPVALLLTLEIPQGFSVEKVEPDAGAEGLTVTVGKTERGKTAVLLDGVPSAVGERVILQVFLSKSGEIGTEKGGYVGVTEGEYGEFALYVLEESGEIVTVPLRFEREYEHDTEEVSEAPKETESETAGAEEDGTDTEPAETVTESDGEEEAPVKSTLYRFVGCQETAARDGRFAVRFLFRGVEGSTPVVCFGGGEGISLEVEYAPCQESLAKGGRAEEQGVGYGKNSCTFRGLDAGRRYMFWVYTEDGAVWVIYENGIFQGYL